MEVLEVLNILQLPFSPWDPIKASPMYKNTVQSLQSVNFIPLALLLASTART